MPNVRNLLFNFWCTVDELMVPELERRILDKLDEGNEQSPRMRAVDNQPLEKHPRDLLLNGFRVGLGEEIQQRAAEVVRVAVGVPQLVGDGVQEQIASFCVEINGQILEDVHV